jgi:hypothetical protein
MIELTCVATIRDVALKAKTSDGVTTRKMRMRLEREFDDEIAAALGTDAIKARALLKSGALAKAEMPLDAIKASALLKNVESAVVKLPLIVGLKAIGKAPDSLDGDTPPSISMLFEFVYTREALVWFGESFGGTAEITITPQQLELLKDTRKPGEPTGKKPHPLIAAAAAQAMGTLTKEHVDAARAYVDDRRDIAGGGSDDDRANAASPEEAEAARAERIAREKADQRAAEGERFAPEIIAAADEAEARFTFMEAECESGPYVVAQFESPTHKMEADGDDREDARLNLRFKLMTVLTADAAAGAPKVGLQVPAGAKAKTHKSSRKS